MVPSEALNFPWTDAQRADNVSAGQAPAPETLTLTPSPQSLTPEPHSVVP